MYFGQLKDSAVSRNRTQRLKTYVTRKRSQHDELSEATPHGMVTTTTYREVGLRRRLSTPFWFRDNLESAS
jgi:hypothetical protein